LRNSGIFNPDIAVEEKNRVAKEEKKK